MPGENLRRRLAALPWPAPTDDDVFEPNKGELWRATWGGQSLIVLLLGMEPADRVRAVAVTDAETGDDRTVVLPGSSSPLPGVTFHIWFGVTDDLPFRVLEERIGPVPPSFLSGSESSGTFPPITSPLDDRARLRAELEDNLADLAAAEWQPADGGPGLADLVDLPPGQFAKLVGMLPGDASLVFERRRALEHAEADRVASILNLDRERVIEATAPVLANDVVALFDHPARCRRLRRRAVEAGITEVQMMHLIADPIAQMAARTTAHEPPDWAALIDDVLGD